MLQATAAAAAAAVDLPNKTSINVISMKACTVGK